MLYNLQLLRAFSALNVVLFHIIATAQSYGRKTDLILFMEHWGANGVHIFFVISGFVMLFTQLVKKRSVRDFLTQRAIRIIPLYWLLTLLIVAIYIFMPFVFRTMVIDAKSLLASLGFMAGAITGKNPIIGVGWTLELEMFFYLVFGLSLWFRSWLATLFASSIILLSVALFISNFILLEFIAGAFIALLYCRYEFKRFGALAFLLGVLLLSLSLLDSVQSLAVSRVVLWGIPSALIVYGAISVPQLKSSLGKLLGDASYSIYLIQVFSIPLFYKFIALINIKINSDFLAISCLLATAIVGVAIYLFVEKPMIHFLKRRIM